MTLQIFKEAKTRIPGKAIQALYECIVKGETRPGWQGHVNLVFTSDQKIRRLNKTYRGKDRPTDVLSFNLDESHAASDIFGELYISAPTARRQADRGSLPLTDEYLFLVCHGLLHLFGYDHMSAHEETAMKSRERHYLAQVGVEVRRD